MKDEVRLDRLRRAAEEASGALRRAADEIDEIAQRLPSRDSTRRLMLELTAGRLRAASDSLTAEVAACSPRTAGWAAKTARAGLAVGSAAILGLIAGGGEGVGADLLDRALGSQRQAEACLAGVDEEAAAAWSSMSGEVDDEVEAVRNTLWGLATHPSSTLSWTPAGEQVIASNGLRAEDLGLPNRRQRVMQLRAALDDLRKIAADESDLGPDDLAARARERVRLTEVARQIDRLIQVVSAMTDAELGLDGGSP